MLTNQTSISVSEERVPEIIGTNHVQIKAQPGLCILNQLFCFKRVALLLTDPGFRRQPGAVVLQALV